MSKKVRNFAPVFEREKVMEQVPSRAAPKHFPKRPGGGMVDAVDSKSAVSNGVGVQVPPGVQKSGRLITFFVLWSIPLSMSIGNVLLTFATVHINIGCGLGCSNTG